jgi:K+-transporting ATPase ATPase A chain
MTALGTVQLLLYVGVVLALAKPLGIYMARVYEGKPTLLGRLLQPVEDFLYRIAGVRAGEEMDWKQYACAVLVFNFVGFLVLYALLRLQGALPANPARFHAVGPALSFNTAISFVTNTNWQSYAGERTMSDLTQMFGLAVQNFLSAASGMAVLVALIRGFARRTASTIGNFWVDTVRGTLYILLPLSLLLALMLVSQGVVRSPTPPPSRSGTRKATRSTQTSPSPNRRWPWGRSHRRSPSSSSEPTAAASSTSIRHTRSRTRRRCPRCWSWSRSF